MTNPEIPATTLERVRKLLAKAEGTDNEHEREAFMDAAAALMAKYGIEQAHVEASDPGRRVRPVRRDITITIGAWVRQRSDLAWCIAEALRCRALILSGNTPYRVAVIGYESDVDRAEMLFTSVLLQMTSAMSRLRTPDGENSRAYRRAWMIGYRSRVVARIKARERQAEQEAEQSTGMPGTELMLLDRKERVVAAYEAEFESFTIRRGRKQRVSGNGYRHGQEAGARANLGGTRIGGGQRGQVTR